MIGGCSLHRSVERGHACPYRHGCVGQHAHTGLCLISTGLHSWKSQNYACHTWFSHQKKIVVADYTPDQRCQYFYRNVPKCHIQLIFVKRRSGASYKMFQKTLSKSLRSKVTLSCSSHKRHYLLYHIYLRYLCQLWLCWISVSRKAGLALFPVPPEGPPGRPRKGLCGLRAA